MTTGTEDLRCPWSSSLKEWVMRWNAWSDIRCKSCREIQSHPWTRNYKSNPKSSRHFGPQQRSRSRAHIFHDRWSKLQHSINLLDERMDKLAVFSQRQGCPGEGSQGRFLTERKITFLSLSKGWLGSIETMCCSKIDDQLFLQTGQPWQLLCDSKRRDVVCTTSLGARLCAWNCCHP